MSRAAASALALSLALLSPLRASADPEVSILTGVASSFPNSPDVEIDCHSFEPHTSVPRLDEYLKGQYAVGWRIALTGSIRGAGAFICLERDRSAKGGGAAHAGAGAPVAESAPAPALDPRAMYITLTGRDARKDKHDRCLTSIASAGFVVDPRSQLRADLVFDSQNHLRVTIAGQTTLDEDRPQSSVKELCDEAVVKMRAAQESHGAPR